MAIDFGLNYDNYDYDFYDAGGYDYGSTTYEPQAFSLADDYDFGTTDYFPEFSSGTAYDFGGGTVYDFGGVDFGNYDAYSFSSPSGNDYSWIGLTDDYWGATGMFDSMSIGNSFTNVTDFDFKNMFLDSTVGALQTLVKDGDIPESHLFGITGFLANEELTKATYEVPGILSGQIGSDTYASPDILGDMYGAPVADIAGIPEGDKRRALEAQLLQSRLDAYDRDKERDESFLGGKGAGVLGGILTGALSAYSSSKDRKAVERVAKEKVASAKYQTDVQAESVKYQTDEQKEIALKELTQNLETYNLERETAINKARDVVRGRAEMFGVKAPTYEAVEGIDTSKYLGDIEELKAGLNN